MKLGPKSSYLCMIPPPPVENISIPLDDGATDVTPAHTWSLLQPLSGSCLYVRPPSAPQAHRTHARLRTQHRQGWFTYAYCHNSHVRQFHELSKPQSQRSGALLTPLLRITVIINYPITGEYRPEEDTEVGRVIVS